MPVSSSTISIVSCMDIKTNSGFDSRCLEPNFASEHAIFSVDLIKTDYFFMITEQ